MAKSIFGAESGKGLVELEVAGAEITISPTEARAFAYSILECAEASETDEFIMGWLENRVGVWSAMAWQVLVGVRFAVVGYGQAWYVRQKSRLS